MKAILEFDLNDPDDKMAHYRCIKSLEMALVIFQVALNNGDIRAELENKGINIEELVK